MTLRAITLENAKEIAITALVKSGKYTSDYLGKCHVRSFEIAIFDVATYRKIEYEKINNKIGDEYLWLKKTIDENCDIYEAASLQCKDRISVVIEFPEKGIDPNEAIVTMDKFGNNVKVKVTEY